MCGGKWLGALFFIGLGAVLIAQNFGLLPVGWNIWNFWPLVFVAIGLSIAFAPAPKPPCDPFKDVNWDDMDDDEIRNELAKAVEGVSKSIAKEIKKKPKKKKRKK